MSLIGQAIAAQGGAPAGGNLPAQQQPAGPGALVVQRQDDFFKVMPSQVEKRAWLRLAESAVKATPEIYNAACRDQGAFFRALLECARLGHLPGTKHYYLTVRGGKIQGVESYLGIVQRILRTGQYSKVIAEVVYDHETFDWNPNTMDRPIHKPDYAGRDETTKPIMSYAYALRWDGTATKVAVADKRYIAKVRRMSKGKVWNEWDETMVLKTSLKNLEKFVETSSEDLRHLAAAAGEAEFITHTAAPQSDPTVVPNEPSVPDFSADFIEGDFEVAP